MGGPGEEHGIVIAKDVMAPMRDGVRLSTDIYRPARDGEPLPGRWPTLLGRTSYDKEAPWLWVEPVAKYFVPRGYAVVLQDLRGRHRSEGKGQYSHVVNPHEGRDGYDTIEWIADQPWSNGRIGTLGVSHGAVVQAALALERPPHLAAMWLDDGFWNWFTNGARQGGALELDTLGMMFLHGHDCQEARDDPVIARAMADAAATLRDWVLQYPLKPGCSPLALVPSLERIFFDYATRGEEDDFWRQACINFEAHLTRFADVPTMVRCGWYDIFALANGAIFPRLRELLRSPVHLIMGPWVHSGAGRSYAGDVNFGPTAALDGGVTPSLQALQLAWFDQWLKGAEERRSGGAGEQGSAGAGEQGSGGAEEQRSGGVEEQRSGGVEEQRMHQSSAKGNEAPLLLCSSAPLPLRSSAPLLLRSSAPVQIFVMGGGSGRKGAGGRLDHGGRWRAEEQWPPARARVTAYYCRAGGELGPESPGGDEPPARFQFDPSHPVPTISGNVASYYEHLPVPEGILPAMSPPRARMRSIVLMGGSHQQEAPGIVGCRPPYPLLAARPDVLVFQTAPLAEPIEVTGPIVAQLWVSSSAVDTDITAKLVDVYPPSEDYPQGYHLNLCDGIQRVRYRAGHDRPRFLEPGQVVDVTVQLGPTSNVFAAGHRIRLDISSSNFPRFDVNPNTGEPVGRHTHTLVAHTTIWHDASRPSHVLLPVVPPADE